MTGAVKSEILKLLTVRGTLGFLLGAIAIAVVAFVAPGENIVGELAKPLHEQQSVFLVGFLWRVLFLVLGIRIVTEEWRYGTITPSLLTVPRRTRFMAAKVVAVVVTGTAMASFALCSMLLTAKIVAVTHNATLTLDEGDIPTLLGMVTAGALWPVIGLGFGAIVKNQLVATVSGLVWLMGVEDMLRVRLDELTTYLPGQAGIAVAVAPSSGVLVDGIGTLAVYALLATLAGSMLFRRRDIT